MKAFVAAAIAIGCVAVMMCAANGGHAPSGAAIMALYFGALVSGLALTRFRAVRDARPHDYEEGVMTRAAGAEILGGAAGGSCVESAIASFVVVELLEDWTSLESASLVGSAWIAGVV